MIGNNFFPLFHADFATGSEAEGTRDKGPP